MTRAGFILLVLAAVAWSSAAPAIAAEEVSADLAWTVGRIGPARSMTLPLKPERPNDLIPPPGLGDPRFARIRWGEGRGLAVALDTRPGQERLYIDTDLDGALDDETPQPWFPADEAGQRLVAVRVAYADASDPLALKIRLARAATWTIDRVQILPQIHRRGEVELGGRLRLVALLDDNADLRFDDPERDHAYVDLDGDGTLRATASSHERVRIGEPFRIGEAAWRLEVASPSGSRVRFVPVDGADAPAGRRWQRARPPKAGQARKPPAEPLELLLERLDKERFEPSGKRLDTIRKLGRYADDDARDPLLVVALRDGDVPVRAAAVRALGNPAWLDAVGEKLVGWSRSGQPAIAQAGLEALHSIGHPGREAVYREVLAGSSAAPVIGAAARHLAYVASAGSRDAVVAAFRAVGDPRTKHQIYLALRTLAEGPPDDVLMQAAKSDDAPLCAAALRDLQTLADPRVHELALDAARRRPMADVLGLALADVLGAVGDGESVRRLLALAPDASGRLEQRLIERLAAVREPSGLDALRTALDADAPRVRRMAAEILGRNPDPEMTLALMDRLKRQGKKDVDGTVAILTALGEHGDERAIDVLLRHAKRGGGAIHQAAVRALARVGMRDERVRSYFVGLLKGRAWEDRMLALGAAGASGDTSFLDEIVKNFRHARWQVRMATAEALGQLRTKRSIPPLIQQLVREDEHRVRDAVAGALYGLTGMNLYDDVDVWKQWWMENEGTFEIPASVDPLPARHEGGTTAGFYGIPVKSNRIIFVLDQSGSMSAAFTYETPAGTVVGTRLDIAMRELLEAVQHLGNKDRVNVILFHTSVHPWRKSLQKLSDRNRDALAKHLHEQKPTGGTNIFDALELALEDPDVKTVFLLSDGAPGAGKYVKEEDILREVRRLNEVRRTAIHTIAVGMDSSLMRRLAEQNDGIYIQEK